MWLTKQYTVWTALHRCDSQSNIQSERLYSGVTQKAIYSLNSFTVVWLTKQYTVWTALQWCDSQSNTQSEELYSGVTHKEIHSLKSFTVVWLTKQYTVWRALQWCDSQSNTQSEQLHSGVTHKAIHSLNSFTAVWLTKRYTVWTASQRCDSQFTDVTQLLQLTDSTHLLQLNDSTQFRQSLVTWRWWCVYAFGLLASKVLTFQRKQCLYLQDRKKASWESGCSKAVCTQKATTHSLVHFVWHICFNRNYWQATETCRIIWFPCVLPVRIQCRTPLMK
jgi:hypothetical protein